MNPHLTTLSNRIAKSFGVDLFRRHQSIEGWIRKFRTSPTQPIASALLNGILFILTMIPSSLGTETGLMRNRILDLIDTYELGGVPLDPKADLPQETIRVIERIAITPYRELVSGVF